VHAKAYFGLARIAALKNDPELAFRLFERILDLSPDDYVRGWTLVYLGRLADAAGDRDEATRRYNAALEVKNASMSARKAAEKGLQEAFRKDSGRQ
jgi:tetratricopeptide (TPR) repeat protein